MSPQPPHVPSLLCGLDELARFDEIIDVRTPAEYEADHIPGAINAPVLDNDERVRVGTLYTQESPFKATRLGAALVARNIAHHLETLFADRPRTWRPLIYCWRGGKRSGAMTAWFNLIGWKARQLDGGYKTYRHDVLQRLESVPLALDFIVLAGPTGSGKTRLLHALARAGAQALDLEALSGHRGSLLGAMPDQPQPSQRGFESTLVQALAILDPTRPVFVEAESPRIGRISLPQSLLARMHAGRCVRVRASLEHRLDFLLQDYAHLFDDHAAFKQTLERFIGLHSRNTVAAWQALIDADRRRDLFRDLVERHYDPAYRRSSGQHYTGLAQAPAFIYDPTAAGAPDQALACLRLAQQAGLPQESTP
ncbi:tRNA 2-selenouridine(34) synthase MnmH [Castellaniella sp. GW247-6E4]|uniref:tRNA 2-selenouridine(34) synthase MnmH n=1 Tax=Castellaniella sp. GW247-6E4 TaxID=3140380 RepID=UPI003314A093